LSPAARALSASARHSRFRLCASSLRRLVLVLSISPAARRSAASSFLRSISAMRAARAGLPLGALGDDDLLENGG
jgi:hypothetical protein